MANENTYALIERAKQGDNAAGERLIEDNSGLVWSIARRFFGRGVDAEDLYQLGCIGFIKAVRSFDPAFGTQLSTYAVPKITGEIRRFLRDDGAIKVSRSLKSTAGKIRHAGETLRAQLDREPTVSELSEALGLSPEEIAACEFAVSPVQSLQKENGESNLTLEGVVGDEGMEDGIIDRLSLRQVLKTLPKREKTVLQLRYFRGMTQEQTARVVGTSQVQVSRIERKAIEMLRERIG